MRARMVALGASLGVLACGQDDGATSAEPEENVFVPALRVLPPDEAYGGKSLEEWAVELMRWRYTWTSTQCLNAENDRDGSRCAFNQPADSPVFFFASAEPAESAQDVVARTRCQVPEGKALLVPISVFTDDDVGSDQPRTPEQIEESVDETHETMRELILVADQNAVEELTRYSVGPSAFDYAIPAAPNWHTCAGIDAEDITVSNSYFAGYFALFEPPTPGKHRLEYASRYTTYEDDSDRRYNISSLFEVLEP